MKIVIPGGSGQLGTLLAGTFHGEGHDVVVLSRFPSARPWPVVPWDGRTPGGWHGEIDGADAVIGLAGRSVNCRYHAANRREILASRVDATRAVSAAIAAARRPPAVWLQASTATIYAHRHDAANDEATGIIGGAEPGAPPAWRFSIDVARAWESALLEVALPATRKVALRSAMVLGPEPGGIFAHLLGLCRAGLGGRAGDGRQYVSWIHDRDFARAIGWLIAHPEVDGPVNVASPAPLPYADFMRALRRAWGAPFGLPAPAFLLEIGCFLMRTESELVLKSRRVVPGRLLHGGFSFHHPSWPEAAAELCARFRSQASHGHG